jgi:hypothetical protein
MKFAAGQGTARASQRRVDRRLLPSPEAATAIFNTKGFFDFTEYGGLVLIS